MIFGDKNLKLLVTDQFTIIVRKNSSIKYQNDFTKEFTEKTFQIPKTFKSKQYDYSDGKLYSFQVNEFKDVNLQDVVDYIKIDKEFFFIRCEKNKYTVCSIDGKSISEIGSLYQYDDSFLYCLVEDSIVKLNPITGEKSTLISLESKKIPVAFCVSKASDDNEMIAFSTKSNKIHISSPKINRVYHWMNKTIVHMIIHDNYVIAVSTSGDVARFHINIQRIEPLFSFNGCFRDFDCKNNRIYFLSKFEFIVFDLMTNSIVFKDILVDRSNFNISKLIKYVNEDKEDTMFRSKKQSVVEIYNMIEEEYEPADHEYQITYTSGCFIFVVNSKQMKVVSQFKIDHSVFNFSSYNSLVSFKPKKQGLVCQVFDIFTDRMVLSNMFSFSWNKKLNIKDAFMIKKNLFVLFPDKLYVLNGMNFLEEVYADAKNVNIKKTENQAFIIDEKGIFNIQTRKYDIKQKNIKNCTVYDGKLIFYIEDIGIYADLPERSQIIEIKYVIDMESRKLIEDGVLKETLNVLYLADGYYAIAVFIKNNENEMMIKIKEYAVDNQSTKILTDEMQSSKSSALLFSSSTSK